MNDADNLAWKLAHVLTGRAGEDLLEPATRPSAARTRSQRLTLIKKAVRVGWALAHLVGERAGTAGQQPADMPARPPQALTLLSGFQPLALGDMLMTGGQDRAVAVRRDRPGRRRPSVLSRQTRKKRYMRDADVIRATIV